MCWYVTLVWRTQKKYISHPSFFTDKAVYSGGMLELFESVEEKDKTAAIHSIIESASPRRDFFLMVILSVAMAAFGVLINSTVVLIGSMLIAPVLYPMLSLALGLTTVDQELISRSFVTIVKSSAIAVGTAGVIGVLFSTRGIETLGVIGDLATTGPSLPYAIIAGISGFAAAFALVKPNLNSMLPGVAISVSLVPPLAIAGLGFASLNPVVAFNALLLYIVNIVGIVLFAMFVFVMLKFPMKQTVVSRAVKEEEIETASESIKEEKKDV